MKIHYSAGSWHGGYEYFFSKALRSLGHDVLYFDDNGTKTQKNFRRIFTRIPRLQYEVEDLYCRAISRDWMAAVRAFKPDLIILEHTPNTLVPYIRAIKKEGYKIFYWMDAPATGSQAKDGIAGSLEADKVFSVDRKWMSILYPPESFTHLPIAGDPETFYPIPGTKKEYDIVWIGSLPPANGDGYLRAKILAELPGKYRIAAFGSGLGYWKRYFPILEERIKSGSTLTFKEMNEIYNKSEIVLNIHSTSNTSALSGRTYEIALSGAFQLVDWREDLDRQYPQGTFATFHYAIELNGLVEKWIGHPRERAEMAARARERVLAQDTYRHRAKEMLKYI